MLIGDFSHDGFLIDLWHCSFASVAYVLKKVSKLPMLLQCLGNPDSIKET